MSNQRKLKRYPIGSTAEFEVEGNYISGAVSNSSMGGILIEVDRELPVELVMGSVLNIRIYDVFSEVAFVYSSKVVRRLEREFAVEFVKPLNETHKSFLKQWLDWQP